MIKQFKLWALLGTLIIVSLSGCAAEKKAENPPAPQGNPPQDPAPGAGANQVQNAPPSAGGGNQNRSYTFPDTSKTIPYRVFLPSTWNASQKLPLVVILHNRGEDQNAPFDQGPDAYKGVVARLAEQYNFIVAAPLGYARSGSYGATESTAQRGPDGQGGSGQPPAGGEGAGAPPAEGGPQGGGPGGGPGGGQGSGPGGEQGGGQGGPQGTPPAMSGEQNAASTPQAEDLTEGEKTNLQTYSEQDVLNVVSLVTQEFNVDPTKIFLMGSGNGTMHLATKYPDLWLAIAPSAGGFDLSAYEALLPTMKVKGAFLVQVTGSQTPGGQGAPDQASTGQAPAGGQNRPNAQTADALAESLKALGVDTRLVTVENTRPSEAWYGVADQIFAFFDTFAKQ